MKVKILQEIAPDFGTRLGESFAAGTRSVGEPTILSSNSATLEVFLQEDLSIKLGPRCSGKVQKEKPPQTMHYRDQKMNEKED